MRADGHDQAEDFDADSGQQKAGPRTRSGEKDDSHKNQPPACH